MKKNWKLISLLSLSMYMLLSYQNCGQNPSFSENLDAGSPNSPAEEFVGKLMTDADIIRSEVGNRENRCSVKLPICLDNSEAEKDLACIKETVSAYYESLACLGFEIFEDEQCFAAASTLEPSAMEPVLLDVTCFNDKSSEPKALELGACHGEDVGFSDKGPSTGMQISSWMDLGNEYPFSRRLKQIVIYPNQDVSHMTMYELDENAKEIQDHCGKTRSVKPTGIAFEIKQKNDVGFN